MKGYLLLFSLTFGLLMACSGDTSRHIIKKPQELSFLAHRDTIKNDLSTQVNVSRYFILENNEVQIIKDSFFLRYIDSMDRRGVDQASYLFYKQSNKTNIKNLLDNPRDLDRYSQQSDLFLVCIWIRKPNLWMTFKYKDGKIVEPHSQIRITDIK